MTSVTARKFTYGSLVTTSIAVAVVIGMYSIFTNELMHVWQKWHLSRIVKLCEATSPVVVPLLGGCLIVLSIWLRILEPPSILNAVHGVLDDMQQVVFAHLDHLPEHERRVTAFKYVWWHWTVRAKPWGGWLIAFERSGSTTRTRVSAFRASPSRPAEAEGVAGQAFTKNLVVPTGLLPEVTADSPEAVLAEYARKTYVSAEWVRRWLKAHPRQNAPKSLCAIPIRAAGRRWGVLVLDACGDIEYNKTAKKKQFSLFADLLGRLLAR